MRTARGRDRTRDASARIAAFERALQIADGRLDADDVHGGRAVLGRGSQRLRLGADTTVVALAGATGSGKSSLFNVLAGRELSAVGVMRPTTGATHASVWGDGASPLLDWLRVPQRYFHESDDDRFDGLVLLDLPDHDSTDDGHRLEAARLVEVVDLTVWVLDPQKYADRALHDAFLRGFETHAGAMLFVLNKIDTLDADERTACLLDARRILDAAGFRSSPLVATSAVTGEGIPELRDVVAERVRERRAATERVLADISRWSARLAPACDRRRHPHPVSRDLHGALVHELSLAAGVPAVGDAVAASHRHRAKLVTGTPWMRWLARFRPDPLKRLHLGTGDADAVPSLPRPSGVALARTSTALRTIGRRVSDGLPEPWPRVVHSRLSHEEGELPARLERLIATVDLRADRPRWWSLVGFLQTVLAAVALAGLLWLTALFVVAWLQLPDPPTYRLGELPLPTALLIGGLLAGALLALLARLIARSGASRRRRRVERDLSAGIRRVVDERVVAALDEEARAYDEFCAAIERASA